ncbi:RNA cap guanine-N2 methyltransferase [seawater metagenome]|uniref:RNA cap guanine-N2 methyltransferase n=1 Tax=seawater metagenome TaxID=1561972 RepID=A0A5E8CLW2_9ZZZZ
MPTREYNRKIYNDTQYLLNILSYGDLPPELQRKQKRFVPEIEPQLIDYDQALFKKFFPNNKDINFRNLKLSNIGAYSITDPDTAQMISDIIKKFLDTPLTITDATANMGGNSINFAQNFQKVNSVEIIPKHCEILENNLKEYKLLDKVNIICKDYLDVMMDIKQDVVFFDPPWGGKDYKRIHNMNLKLDEIDIIDIINAIKSVTKLVVLRVPFNYDIIGFLRRTDYDKVNIFKITGKNKFDPTKKHIRFYVIVVEK